MCDVFIRNVYWNLLVKNLAFAFGILLRSKNLCGSVLAFQHVTGSAAHYQKSKMFTHYPTEPIRYGEVVKDIEFVL